jgi:hypothetical protein
LAFNATDLGGHFESKEVLQAEEGKQLDDASQKIPAFLKL